MVLIPSCIAKVSKQSYYNNCAVKVHVCIGVVLIKRKMVKPAKCNVLLNYLRAWGIRNIIMQPHVTISSVSYFLGFILSKNDQ